METSCHPAENVNESPVQWIIYVLVLVLAVDLMKKKTAKLIHLKLHSNIVFFVFFFSKQENRLQEKIELIHSVS